MTTLLKKFSTRPGDGKAEQSHLTLTFPMKSAADCAAVRSLLKDATADLYQSGDAMGTLHYCRFIALGDDTVCMLADFDGDLESVLGDLPQHFGPILDRLLAHVSDPPPTPVASHAQEFVQWATARCIKPFISYAAAPGATAQQIKSLATAAGIELDPAGAQQLPLLVILPMKGPVATLALKGGVKLLNSYISKGGDAVGTVHFAYLVDLGDDRVGFFTLYDGPFDKYAQDFADRLGPAFDLIFKFTTTSPATPTSKNAGPFTKWVNDHDLVPLAFYSAYPGLLTQDVKALLADGASVQAG